MNIFISNLHLGGGSRTDDFNRDKELLKFLELREVSTHKAIKQLLKK